MYMYMCMCICQGRWGKYENAINRKLKKTNAHNYLMLKKYCKFTMNMRMKFNIF